MNLGYFRPEEEEFGQGHLDVTTHESFTKLVKCRKTLAP